MSEAKRKRLEAAGWKVGTVDEFLELSPEESAMAEIKFVLARELYERRKKKRMSQSTLAKRVGTTQPRLALAENAHESISLDYMVRSLLSVGATRKDIAVAVAGR
jgi:DNA-binding XRE family transcriptional regulator